MKATRFYFNSVILCLILCLGTLTPQLFAQLDYATKLIDSHYFVDAQANLEELLKAEPHNISARFYLGIAYIGQGKYSDALRELKTVESEQETANQLSQPEGPTVFQYDLALARTYLGLHQYKEAWPKLEAARIENPDSSDVFLYRGVYFYEHKDFDKAIVDLEKALKLDSNNVYAYYYAGMTYYKLGQPDQAVELMKRFLELVPDAPEAPEVKKIVDELC